MGFWTSLTARFDGWANVITGLGVAGRDRQQAARFAQAPRLDRAELEELYRGDALAAKIVDRLPNDMTRKGWEVKADDAEAAQIIEEAGRALDLATHINTGFKWARLHGGAALILGIDDGQSQDMPLDLGRIRALRFVVVLDRWQMSVAARYTDPAHPRYGKPEVYRLNPATGQAAAGIQAGQLVHETRVIPIVGVPLPERAAQEQDGWGDSVLVRPYGALRGYHTAHDSAATIISDFTQSIYKIKGLAGIFGKPTEEAALKKRLEIVDYTRSVVRAVMMDAENEEFTKAGTPVTGLPDLMDRVDRRLVAESDMPHTLLLGESPGASLGEQGASQARDWYDHVAGQQEAQLRPRLMYLYELIALSTEGPTRGVKPEGLTITFVPLQQMDPVQEAARRKAIADADAIYLTQKVLSPEEVAQSRFGGDGYSADTTLIAGTVRLADPPDAGDPMDPEEDPTAPDGVEDPEGAPDPKVRADRKEGRVPKKAALHRPW